MSSPVVQANLESHSKAVEASVNSGGGVPANKTLEQATTLNKKSSKQKPAPDAVTPAVNNQYSDFKEQRLAELVEKLQSEAVVKDLLAESQKIEEQIFLGENEVFHKNEEAFFMVQDENETLCLKTLHNEDVKALKALHEQQVQDVLKRKAAKRFQRQQQREVKALYNKTHEQDIAYKKIEEVKKKLAEHRERTEKLIDHIEERHVKQIKQFNAAEARRIADQKLLVELKVAHLTEEQKIAAIKENQSKINHQKALDKKKLDQIREQQRRELRHLKEEFSNMNSTQILEEQDMINKHKLDYLLEKEKITATESSIKVIKLQAENQIELTKLINQQKQQLRQLRRAQKTRKAKRFKHWSAIIQRDLLKKNGGDQRSTNASNFQSSDASQSSSVGSHSLPESQTLTRQSSDKNLNKNLPLKNNLDLLGEEDEEDDTQSVVSLDTQQQNAEEKLQTMVKGLIELKNSQEEELEKLRKKIKEEKQAKEEEFQKLMMELDWQKDVNLKDLKIADEAEINEAITVQERELEMESHIRQAEVKALMERKVLKNLLDSVVDGVISIDPK
ncbi:hypothetical protein HK099_001950, partial [Clydaea vesicula]